MNIKELEEKRDRGALVVDIREEDEVLVCPSLPDVLCIPLREFIAQVHAGQIAKDREVITVCQSGARCEYLTQMLRAEGYQASHLDGGLNAWQ